MIKINLAPAEELASPFWWAPDAIVFSSVFGIAMLTSFLILSNITGQIDTVNAEKSKLDQENESLKGDVDRYASISKEIAELQRIKESYSRITETKLARYLPIIILEHLQNLKPQGVWFTKVEFLADEGLKPGDPNAHNGQAPGAQPPGAQPPGAQPPGAQPPGAQPPAGGGADAQSVAAGAELRDHTILIAGNALNNVILGEFMTVIQATQNGEFDPEDLRTQAFFKVVNLDHSQSKKTAADTLEKEKLEGPSPDFVEFQMKIPYNERIKADAPRDMKLSQLLGGKKPEVTIIKNNKKSSKDAL